MTETLLTINYWLAVGGILMMIATVLLVIDYRKTHLLAPYVERFGSLISLASVFGASVMTLVYSEIFGVIPCGLCWLERIALYPQILLILTALYFKDTLMPRYGIVLSTFGLVVSLYHHYIQMGGSEFIKCPAAGKIDCAERYIFEFNFITFPLLAAILFAFLIVLYLYLLKVNKKI